MDSGFCKCEFCWGGKGCDFFCMGWGMCLGSGICDCDFFKGWWGDVCEVFGCFGFGEDCIGNGDCNSVSYECMCYFGWVGIGCYILDCFGVFNCNDCGYCNVFVSFL